MKKLLSAALAAIVVASSATIFASAADKEFNRVLFFDGAATAFDQPIDSDSVDGYSDNVGEYIGNEAGITYSCDVAFIAKESKAFRRRGSKFMRYGINLGVNVGLYYNFDGPDPTKGEDKAGFQILYTPGPFYCDVLEVGNYYNLAFTPDDSIKFDGAWHNFSFVRNGNTVAIYHNGEKKVEHTFSNEDHGCEGCTAKYEQYFANGFANSDRPFFLQYPKFVSCYMDNVVMASGNYVTDPDNATIFAQTDFESIEAGSTVGDGTKTADWYYRLKNSDDGNGGVNANFGYSFIDIEVVTSKKGDVDGDGDIDVDDILLLVQNQAGWESAKDVAPGADVNGDTKVDADDVILLVQYLAGWQSAKDIVES